MKKFTIENYRMSLTFKPKVDFTDMGFWFILLLFLLITKIISLSALDSGLKDHYFTIAHFRIYFAYAIFLIFIGVLYFTLNAFGKSLNKRLSLMHLLGSICIMIVFLLQECIDHNLLPPQVSAPEGSKIH